MFKGFIAVAAFGFGLFYVTSPASAEEVQEEPGSEVVVEVVEEPGSEVVIEVVEEPPSTETGVWSVLNENNEVVNAIICSEAVCGESGRWGGALPQNSPCPNCRVVFQQPGDSGSMSDQNRTVTYDDESQSHHVETRISHGDGVEQIVNETIEQTGEVNSGKVNVNATDGNQSVTTEIAEGFLDEEGNFVRVEFPDWKEDLILTYEKPSLLIEGLQTDVDNIIEEDIQNEIVEEPTIIDSINAIVDKVVNFFIDIFDRGNNE